MMKGQTLPNLTYSALFGLRKQSAEDAERLLSGSMASLRGKIHQCHQ